MREIIFDNTLYFLFREHDECVFITPPPPQPNELYNLYRPTLLLWQFNSLLKFMYCFIVIKRSRMHIITYK